MAYIKISREETRQKYKEMGKNGCALLSTASKEGAGNKHEVLIMLMMEKANGQMWKQRNNALQPFQWFR
jgi:hypothetical protein